MIAQSVSEKILSYEQGQDLDATVPEFEVLLDYLKHEQGCDLTGYKRPSLMRRTRLQMQCVNVENFLDYLALLKQQPDEITHLLNTVFINFTYFFRDPLVWVCLADQVIPQMLAHKAVDEPIRVWSAGCASGEETYSLAMLLAEVMGVEQFQQRVQIYGTDIDPDAIQQARRGEYPTYQIEPLPLALRKQYFERRENCYSWRQDFRSSIHFQCHNLVQELALPQIDLLVCRNLLMYLTEKTQLQVLRSFYSSMEENGFLLLGKAENLLTRLQLSLFTPLHQQSKIFARVPEAQQNKLLRIKTPEI